MVGYSETRAVQEEGCMTSPGGSNSRMVSVFFYGLFMDADMLRSKGFHPANERQASVAGMALRVGQRAALALDTSKSTYGFVMDLSQEELARLYSEPSVAAYRPQAIIARLTSGHTIAAFCYNLPVPPQADERNPAYAAKLRELGRRLGLPHQYVESIG